ncbi:putative papa-1-like conserved region protein [Venturia nashicola]|uniref:Putative papa-1-like conserved region protein n=1 Tax=Venturia nashicola TaxID=86259 RepID=A0A4Z1PG90_9PEZI|nr:putative papa-1-like conserved region protein [Venturia nashicola]
MPATRRLRSRNELTAQSSVAQNSASRPRRAAASGTTIERSSPADDRTTSIRLTVKSDPKKLQQATRGQAATARSGRSHILPDLAEIVSGPRLSRKKAIVEESSEEEDEDEQTPAGYGHDDEDELSDEDAEGDDDEDEDMDAEGEDDEEMVAPPPVVRASAPRGQAAKPQVKITPAQELPSVEEKEMAMDDDDDDDELSELDEDAEGELDDELGGEDDAEGEEDDDSDGDISASVSRGDTPDLSKLTSRQRRQFEDADDGSLLALSNEAQKKKVLTEEEHNMRRTEMARRRKNLSEKRNEEEKQDTINRLLKKQAPKRRSKAEKEADLKAEEEADPDRVVPKANPIYIRTVKNASGTRLHVPEGLEGAPFGPHLANSKPEGKAMRPYSGRLVEEFEEEEEQRDSSKLGQEDHNALIEDICNRVRTAKPCNSLAEAAKFMEISVFLKSLFNLAPKAGDSVACLENGNSQPGEDTAGGEEPTTAATNEASKYVSDLGQEPPKKKRMSRLMFEIRDCNERGEQEEKKSSARLRSRDERPSYNLQEYEDADRKATILMGYEL